jgi:hypothetical protein
MAALVMECDEIAGYGSARYVLFVLGYAGHELVFKIPVFCDHLTVVLVVLLGKLMLSSISNLHVIIPSQTDSCLCKLGDVFEMQLHKI